MSSPTRLLVVACSGRKVDPGYLDRRPELGIEKRAELPLVELYDGPAWRMVRKAYACGGRLVDSSTEVWALSALHGLVPCYARSKLYDRRLETDAQALELADAWALDPFDSQHFANVARGCCEITVFGGAVYGVAFSRYCQHVEAHHAVDLRYRRFAGRGIGDMLGGLRRYLDAVEARAPEAA